MTNLYKLAAPGDLLFYQVTPKSSLISRFIAASELLLGEGAGAVQYSHVAILDHDLIHCIEAKWPKVRYSPVDWDDRELELLRAPMSPTQRLRVLYEAGSHVGEWYDLPQLLFGWFRSKQAYICTTLVRTAFSGAGLGIGEGAGKLLTPNELIADPSLELIGRISDTTLPSEDSKSNGGVTNGYNA